MRKLNGVFVWRPSGTVKVILKVLFAVNALMKSKKKLHNCIFQVPYPLRQKRNSSKSPALTIYRKHPLQKNFHNLMSKGKTRIMISFSLHIFIDWLEFFPSVISLKLFDWSVRIIWKFCHLMDVFVHVDEHDVQKILYYVLLIWLTGI